MESIINDELNFDEKKSEIWKCDEKYDIVKLMEKSPSPSISYPKDLRLHKPDYNQEIELPIKPIVPPEPLYNKSRNFFNKNKKLTLCNKLNTKNIIRNDELKFLPQIEICFNINPNKIFELKDYNDFRNELKLTLKEEDFSIIKIEKGSIKVIITLQFLIFSEISKNGNFWLWDSKTKNGIDKLDTFNKNICFKIKEILSKFRDQNFIS